MSQENLYQRTLQDSKVLISHAKLTEDELCPITQAIYMGNSMTSFKLMEVPPSLLSELQKGNRVVFRGDRESAPVLCTENTTFQVKEAETSNSLCLLPGLLYPDNPNVKDESKENRELVRQNIEGTYYSYIELKPCKPRFSQLTSILEESAYVDHIIENKSQVDTRKLYTKEDLLNVIHSSEKELEDELKRRNAGLINGHIRILEPDYNFRMLSHILNLVDSNSWSTDQIDREETRSTLTELVPDNIMELMFENYLVISDKTKENGEPYFKLIEDKVCQVIAEALLRPTKRFVLSEFLTIWQAGAPEGLQVDLKQLERIAFVNKLSKPPVVEYFPEVNLSEDIKTRIDQLFSVQDKWTLDDIRPYIEGLATEKLNVNALLTKYARASNENGVRYFSSRLGR